MKTIRIECIFCKKVLAITGNFNQSLDKIALKSGGKKVKIKIDKENVEGYICNKCLSTIRN